MEDYDALTERYDQLVRDIIPHFTKETVDRGMEAMNNAVNIFKPLSWPVAFSMIIIEPKAVLGITSDQERVVYRDDIRLGHYHAVPFDEIHQRVLGMLAEAKTEYNQNKDHYDPFFRQATYDRMVYTERLLEDLVALRP